MSTTNQHIQGRPKTYTVYDPDTHEPLEQYTIPNEYIYTLSNTQYKALYYIETIFRNIGIRTKEEERTYQRIQTILTTKEYQTKDQAILNDLMVDYKPRIIEYLRENS